MSQQPDNKSAPSYFRFFALGLDGLATKLLLSARANMYDVFVSRLQPNTHSKILDVGVSADENPASNYLEKHHTQTENITACSIDHFPELERQFPGLRFIQSDARALPFKDKEFDIVHSHAVIEHVGSRAMQKKFILELLRVSKSSIYFTCPNRHHPLEFHTGIPFAHWFPGTFYRPLYKRLGKAFYASENTLNLLSPQDIKHMLSDIDGISYQIDYNYFLNIRANILVSLHKKTT